MERIEKLARGNHPASMNNQKNKVHQLFKNWKKDQEQVDDVCMLSVTF